MAESKTTTFFKGLSVQTAFTLAMAVLEMVVFSILSRLLSKSDFGYFAAMTGVMTIFQSISEAGLGSSVIQKKDPSEDFLSTAFKLSVGMGALGSFIVFVLAPWLSNIVSDDYLIVPIRIMAFTILLNSLVSMGNAQLYRKLNFKRISTISLISYVLASISGLILAYKGFGLYAIIAYTALMPLFTMLFLYSTSVKIPKGKFDVSEARGIVSYGGWLTLSVIAYKITQQLDKLIIPRAISVEALGAYNRPAGFTMNTANKIQNIFDSVLFPMLSDIQNNKEQVLGVFYRAVGLLNSFSVILACVFFFNAELIISIFFGNQWLDLVPVMRIVSFTIVFYVDSQLVDVFFRSLNLVKYGFYLRLAALFLTAGALIIGVRFGIIGVAISLAAINIFIIIIKVIVLSYKVDAKASVVISQWIKAWRPSIIPIIMGIAFLSFIDKNVLSEILFAIAMSIVLFAEFIVFPKMVSEEYVNTVSPLLNKVKTKFIK